MNNSTIITVVISVATFLCSVGVSAFVAGTRWGRVEQKMQNIDTRLARIEGMFTLRLKGGPDQ